MAVVAEVDVVVEGEGSDYNQSLRRRDDSLVEERDTIDRKQGKVDHYQTRACILYTSDAADEGYGVDLRLTLYV